ncbi:MAG: class I SAM-dependent methyltransferase [Clostridiales bacterium]|nr:class I SAM-dependent methyltransferase [Clostridiales bacterium]
MENNLQKNADRFTGFADTYDNARPAMPIYPVKIITKYLGKIPDTIIDLGCGTGLSTLAWQNSCKRAIGIEPSADMLAVAKQKEGGNICFMQGFGDKTGLDDACADAVICSQSFHWMEPAATLKEIDRILKSGGVFATVDCDWPPVSLWQAELEYMKLYKKVKALEASLDDVSESFTRYPKDRHLDNIKASGAFKYCRELVFQNTEKCTAKRFVGLILSQGSLQTVLKLHPELIAHDIDEFKADVTALFGAEEFEIDFSYRMRVGIKAEVN